MTLETMTRCRGHAVELDRTDGVLPGFSAGPRKYQAIARAMRRRADRDEQHRDDQRRCAQKSAPSCN